VAKRPVGRCFTLIYTSRGRVSRMEMAGHRKNKIMELSEKNTKKPPLPEGAKGGEIKGSGKRRVTL